MIARVPVIAGEIGETDCSDAYIGPLMRWLDARSGSYVAWAWHTDMACAAGPGLISSYGGTPTPVRGRIPLASEKPFLRGEHDG